jgi:hypothetical protein
LCIHYIQKAKYLEKIYIYQQTIDGLIKDVEIKHQEIIKLKKHANNNNSKNKLVGK